MTNAEIMAAMRAAVEEAATRHGSLAALCKAKGLPYAALHAVLTGKRQRGVSAELTRRMIHTFPAIAEAFGVRPCE